MKIMNSKYRTIVKYVDIIVDIDDYDIDNSIAANLEAKTFQPHVKHTQKMSDEALTLYTNFIEGVLTVIESMSLKVIKHYQSKKAYTYYIHIDHVSSIEDVPVLYKIIFRIGNHINPTLRITSRKSKSYQFVVPIIKQIHFKNYDEPTYTRAMVYLNQICNGIANDDESVLTTELAMF